MLYRPVPADAVQGDPSDGRQVLGDVPCLRSRAVMPDAVGLNCDGRQLLGDMPCLNSHAVMTDAVQGDHLMAGRD